MAKETSSEIGQLLLYLVVTHFKRFSVTRAITAPVLGLYIKDMKVSVSVYAADVCISVYNLVLTSHC